MKVSDRVQVNHLGAVTHGNRAVNPVGLRLHASFQAFWDELIASDPNMLQ
jgi:hypothetical protein